MVSSDWNWSSFIELFQAKILNEGVQILLEVKFSCLIQKSHFFKRKNGFFNKQLVIVLVM